MWTSGRTRRLRPDGRLWKYCGSGLPSESTNDCPMILLPTGLPSAPLNNDPSGLAGEPRQLSHGDQSERVGQPEYDGEDQQRPQRGEVLGDPTGQTHLSHPRDELDDQIDQLDADERRDDPAKAVDEQVAGEQLGRAARPVAHSAQR